MSIKRMTAVWELSEHEGSALLLLLALADHAKDNGLCWPGYEKLAFKTRTSRRNLPRLIDKVTASGEAWAINRRRHQSNLYVVTPGLDLDGLLSAVGQVLEMGAVATRNSDKLALPPQVLGVVTNWHYSDPIPIVSRDILSLGSILVSLGKGGFTAKSAPEPSLNVTETGMDLWKPVLDELKLQMTETTFNTWLLGSRLELAEGGKWVVNVRHPHAVDWLSNRLMPVVMRTVQRHEPEVRAVEFVSA